MTNPTCGPCAKVLNEALEWSCHLHALGWLQGKQHRLGWMGELSNQADKILQIFAASSLIIYKLLSHFRHRSLSCTRFQGEAVPIFAIMTMIPEMCVVICFPSVHGFNLIVIAGCCTRYIIYKHAVCSTGIARHFFDWTLMYRRFLWNGMNNLYVIGVWGTRRLFLEPITGTMCLIDCQLFAWAERDFWWYW